MKANLDLFSILEFDDRFSEVHDSIIDESNRPDDVAILQEQAEQIRLKAVSHPVSVEEVEKLEKEANALLRQAKDLEQSRISPLLLDLQSELENNFALACEKGREFRMPWTKQDISFTKNDIFVVDRPNEKDLHVLPELQVLRDVSYLAKTMQLSDEASKYRTIAAMRSSWYDISKAICLAVSDNSPLRVNKVTGDVFHPVAARVDQFKVHELSSVELEAAIRYCLTEPAIVAEIAQLTMVTKSNASFNAFILSASANASNAADKLFGEAWRRVQADPAWSILDALPQLCEVFGAPQPSSIGDIVMFERSLCSSESLVDGSPICWGSDNELLNWYKIHLEKGETKHEYASLSILQAGRVKRMLQAVTFSALAIVSGRIPSSFELLIRRYNK